MFVFLKTTTLRTAFYFIPNVSFHLQLSPISSISTLVVPAASRSQLAPDNDMAVVYHSSSQISFTDDLFKSVDVAKLRYQIKCTRRGSEIGTNLLRGLPLNFRTLHLACHNCLVVTSARSVAGHPRRCGKSHTWALDLSSYPIFCELRSRAVWENLPVLNRFRIVRCKSETILLFTSCKNYPG